MAKRLDQMEVISKAPLNAESPFAALRLPLTPNEVFYVRNHFALPEAQAASWSLSLRVGNKIFHKSFNV